MALDNNSIFVGEKVRKLREAKGWTQKELGEKLGLKQSNIGNIERGINKLNQIDSVNKFLDIFHISFDYLFEDILAAFENYDKSDYLKEVQRELFQMDMKDLMLANDITQSVIKYKQNEMKKTQEH